MDLSNNFLRYKSNAVQDLKKKHIQNSKNSPPKDAATLANFNKEFIKNCLLIDKKIDADNQLRDARNIQNKAHYKNAMKEYNDKIIVIKKNINNHNTSLDKYNSYNRVFIQRNNSAVDRFNKHTQIFKQKTDAYISKLKEIQNIICGQPQDIYHSIINDPSIKIHSLPDTSCDNIKIDLKEPNTSEPPILQWFKLNNFSTYGKNTQKKYLFSNIDSIEIKQTYKTKISDIKIINGLGDNVHDYKFTKKEKERLFDTNKIYNIDTYDINENDDISTGSFTEVKINTRNQDNTSESLYIKKESLVIGWNIIILNPYTLKVEEYKNFYDDPEEIDLTQKWESASGKIVSSDKKLINENVFTNWGGRCYSKDREWGVEHKGTHDCSPHTINKDGEKIIMGKKYLPIASWAPSSAKEDCANNKDCKVLSCDYSEFNGGHNRWVDPNDHTKYLSRENDGIHKVVSEDVITGKGVCNAYGFKPINWRESLNETKKDPSWTLDNGMTGDWSWKTPVTYEWGKKCQGDCIDNRADWKLNKVYLKPTKNTITKASTKAFNDMNEWFNTDEFKNKYDKHIVIITVQNPLLQKASKADPKFNDSFDTLMKLCSCNLTSKDLKLNDTNNSENPQFLNIIGKINITGKTNNVGTYGCVWKKNNFNSKDNTYSTTNDSLTTVISKNKVEHIFNSPNQQIPTYKLDENIGKNLIDLIKEDINVSKCLLPVSSFKINNIVIYNNKQYNTTTDSTTTDPVRYSISKLVNLIFKPDSISVGSPSSITRTPSTNEENKEIISILHELYNIYKNDVMPKVNWSVITTELTNDDNAKRYDIGLIKLPTLVPCTGYQDCNVPEWGKNPYPTKTPSRGDGSGGKSDKDDLTIAPISWINQKRNIKIKTEPELPPEPTPKQFIKLLSSNACSPNDTEGFQSDFKNNYNNNKINIYTLLHFLLLLSIVYALFYILQRTNIKKNMLYIYFTIITVIIIITFIIILNV